MTYKEYKVKNETTRIGRELVELFDMYIEEQRKIALKNSGAKEAIIISMNLIQS